MQSGGQRTVTVKWQHSVFPALSLAQQVTVVMPTGKLNVGGGLQTTESSWQLSVAVGNGYPTMTGLQFSLNTTMLLGQVITGGIVSGCTMTSKQQNCGTAPATVFVQHTFVIPTGNGLPEGGKQSTGRAAPLQSSKA
jgi:hypothetical protein